MIEELIVKQAEKATEVVNEMEEWFNEAVRTIEGLVEVVGRMSPSSIAMLRKKYPMVDQMMGEGNG